MKGLASAAFSDIEFTGLRRPAPSGRVYVALAGERETQFVDTRLLAASRSPATNFRRVHG